MLYEVFCMNAIKWWFVYNHLHDALVNLRAHHAKQGLVMHSAMVVSVCLYV